MSRWWNRFHSTFFLCSTNLEKKIILSLQCLSVLLLNQIMPSWDCVCGRLLYFLYHRVCFSVVLTFVASEVISSGNIKLCRRPRHSPPCSEENGGSVELHPFIVITCAGQVCIPQELAAPYFSGDDVFQCHVLPRTWQMLASSLMPG